MRRVIWLLCIACIVSVAFADPTYFVKADMVRGAEGAQGLVCVPNSVFVPGEMIVFRAVVYDGATGEELGFDQVQERGISAVVHMDGRDDAPMFFPPPQAGDPPGAGFFRGPWTIPADFASGAYGWSVSVSDSQGNTAEFQPIGAAMGAGSVTIQAAE